MKKFIATTATIGVLGMAALIPATASAQIGYGSALGNAFVLNSLFGGPFGIGSPFTSFGDVLLWNQLLYGGYGLGAFGLGYGRLGGIGL